MAEHKYTRVVEMTVTTEVTLFSDGRTLTDDEADLLALEYAATHAEHGKNTMELAETVAAVVGTQVTGRRVTGRG